MKFKVSRTSIWDDEVSPCKGVIQERYTRFEVRTLGNYEEFDKKFGASEGNWLSKGTNHCVNDRGYVQREHPEGSIGWFLEIDTLDELLDFKNKHGQIIIQECYNNPNIIELEIYDDYRE